jgi:NAD(P)-dependent dehydrogenase (short-subunit alcohol dehydrogenase family)
MTLADFSVEGRVALMTGASKGLGAEIARVMAEAGADVVASARDMAGLQATAAAVAERVSQAVPGRPRPGGPGEGRGGQ